ncbi:DNA repair protein RadA [Candidatus Shapirobacteria bacterium CG_4_9_14_3_um_filter_36_12]|uniref:DNA repair protein RadA n=1 Tax=Candidatus Shapirobacteria bacterium CG_4_9_14_3_um_filter_36_12 TaxID=1974877 RepID=A0A2M7XNR1_9BACT|nr:MAG: DNA repair protein RadA [Candidatus Shapirobacteria bacterium CG_4_9_14_3_um_filter_36_12]
MHEKPKTVYNSGMKKILETVFVCNNCGNEFAKWSGQCPTCKSWNALQEFPISNNQFPIKGKKRSLGKIEVKKLSKIKEENNTNQNVFSTQISEFDRVLGKGIVRGSVVLFAGEPGIGKSTLLTQLVGKNGGLYVAGEESAEQINLRVRRLGLSPERFDVLETNSVEEIGQVLERTNNVYKIVVVDSIQTMLVGSTVTGTGTLGSFGSVNQIRESTFRLVELAKKTGVAIFIVGHVTKEGDIAGPKLLEHMVDTVLYFEGEKKGDLRILRVSKNRFGPTDEVGVFQMSDAGLSGVRNLNLSGSGESKVGSAITIVMEGTRSMMVEIQALVTESFASMPTRVFSGIDNNRGRLLVAVAQKVLGMPLWKYDVYVSVTGGIRVDDTGCDLAIMGAMYSSFKEKPIKMGGAQGIAPVLIGEVSLLGEVKKVRGWEKREKEAKAMGRVVPIIYSIGELKNLI